MKFGIRKPSLKKSLKARTTGKLKRSVKKALIPGYGKKGMGWIKNPKKAAYNKVYNKTSVSLFSAGTSAGKTSRKSTTNTASTKKSTLQNNQFESQVYSYIEGETEAMKVCKFCGAENQDSAAVCSSCGGNEFKHKCGNCGTVFEDGNFCPKCGVKAGAKAKKCPNCGAEYFSVACPDCGYTNKAGSTTVVYTNTTAQPVKKRKTWLWVLGWIFIFPVPLTILMVRNQKLNKWVKIGIIAVAWILYLIIALAGGSGDEENKTVETGDNVPSIVSSEDTTQNTTDNPENIDSSEGSETVFAEDTIVNRFITEFNDKSQYEITDITKGNIRTNYFGYANGRYLEMINANGAAAEAFCVTINGGQDDAAKQSMYEVFRETVKILDPSITDDVIDAALAEFDEKDVLIEGYKIGDSITATYVPTKELSYGKNSCRIDISASNYK
jgi:ribosomal protein L40E